MPRIAAALGALGLVLSVSLPSAAEDEADATTDARTVSSEAAAEPHEQPAAERQRTVPSAFSPYRSLSDSELTYAYEQTALGGPIALTVVGGVITVLALPTFLVSGIGSLVCSANQVGDCTGVDTVTVVSGVSTVAFGTMTIVGVVMLTNRSHKRSAIKNEMWRRQAESASLTLGLAPVRGGSMLAIGGTF